MFVQEAAYDIGSHLLQLKIQSVNQSIQFTFWGREPDVSHWTSWLDSTAECVWQPKAADQIEQYLCIMQGPMQVLPSGLMHLTMT